jgi:type I restriction enzyme S subunit
MKYRYREPHELKESGIEWIGKIPKEWNRTKLKNLVKIKITDGPHESPEFIDEGIPFLSAESIVNSKLSFENKRGYISEEQHRIYEQKSKVILNDILFCKSGSTTGKSALVETTDNFGIWSPLAIIRANEKINYKNLFYFMQSTIFRKQVENFWSFGTQPNIGMGTLENLFIAFGRKEKEQSLIASFLDKKCAEFDGIIEKKERIISKLEEAKKSLISEVVTGKVKIENGKIIPRKKEEMKESGIEWIGKIPEEWEVTRVKRFLESQKQGFYTTEDYADSGVKLVRITDINDSSEISYEKCPHVEINEKDKRIFDLKKGDFLFARSGTIGRFGVVENEENAVFASYLIRFRFSNIKERYLKHYFSSELFKACLFSSLHGGANQNIHAENIKEPFLMVPSDFEQSFIASFLDEKTAEIDSVITKIRDQIEKIKKAKQSLISEAVTGKIEVMEEK